MTTANGMHPKFYDYFQSFLYLPTSYGVYRSLLPVGLRAGDRQIQKNYTMYLKDRIHSYIRCIYRPPVTHTV